MSIKDLIIDELSYQIGFEEGRKLGIQEETFGKLFGKYIPELEEIFFSSPIVYPKGLKGQILFLVIEEGIDNMSLVAKKVDCSREYVRQVVVEEASGLSYYKQSNLKEEKVG